MASIGGDLYAQFELMTDEQRDQVIDNLLDRWIAKHMRGCDIDDNERAALRVVMVQAIEDQIEEVRANARAASIDQSKQNRRP